MSCCSVSRPAVSLAATVIVAVLSGPQRASGQPAGVPEPVTFVHEQWTVQDGLPVNSINSVLQSRDGYIWAATYDGLVRFDGVRFTVFNTGNSPGLPSNRLVALRETRDLSLWMLTEQSQLVRFRDGRFTRVGPEVVASVPYEDSNGDLWVGTATGLARIEDGRSVPVAEGRIPAVTAVVRRSDGSVWVGTAAKGLFRLAGERVEQRHARSALDSMTISTLFEDPGGKLWIGTVTGVWLDDGRLRRVPATGPPLTNARAFAWLPRLGAVHAFSERGFHRLDGNHAIASDTGVIDQFRDIPLRTDAEGSVWHGAGRRLYRDARLVFTLPVAFDDGFAPTMITSLAIDREGSVWLGTRAGGLHRVKPGLFTTLSKPEGLVEANVYTVYQDRSDAIWVGSLGNGMSRIAPDGQISSFPTLQGRFGRTNAFDADREDRLWIATDDGVYRCALPAFSCARDEAPALGRQWVWALFRDSKGRLWAGGSERAFRRDDDRWTTVPDWPARAPVRAFAETPDGTIWMGTNGAGVLRYNNDRVTRLADAEALLGTLVRSLYVDADGWLWVGTEGRGLARIDPRSWDTGTRTARRVAIIRKSDGLFDETIHQILEDNDGRVWMNTNRGIFWVARSELLAFAEGRARVVHSTSYTERDGIRNREGNGGVQPAGVRARDGRIWFPTQEGVVFIDPASLQRNAVVPPVAIERIVAGDSAVVTTAGRAEFGVGQRDLQIEFTALSFVAPGNVRFRYRLEPYDADWVDAGNRRAAFYTRVPPGRYTFRVIAANGDGLWNEEGARVALALPPHLWETTPFRAAVLLSLLIAAVWAAHWWRLGAERRALELERVVEERTAELRENERQLAAQNAQLGVQASKLAEHNELRSRLFANLSHEFRTPLTLILGPVRSLLDGRHGALTPAWREQGELMHRNGQRLLRLINQILDLSRLQAGAVTLDRRPHDLVGFARDIALAFAPLAERRGIALRFSSASEQLVVAFDAEQMEKVLLNLVSNAFKFTERDGEVEVTVRATPSGDGGEIAVRDTGVGIAPEALPRVFERFYQSDSSATRRFEGTGIGLALARELVELHGGTVRASSVVGEGSTFTIGLPFGDLVHFASEPLRDGMALGSGAHGDMIEARIGGDDASDVETGIEPDDGLDRTTVLVVDDNPDVRDYVRSVLATKYHVIGAGDGRAGVACARAMLPDCIVADVMMPELDGLALARALKDDAMTDAIPVILLTARAASEDHVAGLETGADAYLVKPFDPAVLEACVANLLAQRRRLRERFAAGGALPVAIPAATVARSPLEEQLRGIVEARLTDPELGAESLAAAAGKTYLQLYRAMQASMDTSPTRFIRGVRVECAAALLREGAGSVTEVAYSVGFESLSYFSRAYRERFGVSPSAHLRTGQRVDGD